MPAIDQYSVSTVPVEMFFGQTPLGVGTGFVWQSAADVYFLITNWHNVSGKDPFTGNHIHKMNGEPDRLRIWWNQKNALGSKFSSEQAIKDADNNPIWLIHPQHGNQVDVVAVPVAAPPNAEMYPINKMPSDQLLLQIGMDVFILGYPFGIGPGGLPIWKRGSIASEPDILDPARPTVFVDTASRPGMSGSPVIKRSWGTHLMENGGSVMNGAAATRFVGVYSGRLITDDPNDAQLGLTWPAKFVDEIIAGGRRDT